MVWHIDGEPQDVNPGGYDGRIWVWRLVNEHGVGKHVHVKLSRTAVSMSDDALASRVVMARNSMGRSEIDRVAVWDEPPRAIEFHSMSIEPLISGGDPGPLKPERELFEIADWFESRGMLLIFSGRSMLSAEGTPTFTRHTAHLIVAAEDELLKSFEADTRLEAARQAKAWWEEEHPDRVVIRPPPAEASATMPVPTVENESERLRTRGFHLMWTLPSPDDKDSLFMLEVFDDAGNLIDCGLGDDREDALLGVAERLLPDEE